MKRGAWILPVLLLLGAGVGAWILSQRAPWPEPLPEVLDGPNDDGRAVILRGQASETADSAPTNATDALVRSWSIHVHDVGGPIAGATLGYLVAEGSFDIDERLRQTLRTGRDGYAKLTTRLQLGVTHQLRVSAPHHLAQKVWLPSGGEVRVQLVRTTRKIRVAVRNAAGEPVTDAHARLVVTNGSFQRIAEDTRRTDDTGELWLPIPDFGTCNLSLHGPKHRSVAVTFAAQELRDRQRFEVTLEGAPDLSGTISDGITGEPVANALISNTRGGTAQTDGSGFFRIAYTQWLDIEATGYRKRRILHRLHQGRTIEVQLFAKDATHPTGYAAMLSGRIVDVTGTPLVGALVQASQSSTLTDGDGRYELKRLPSWVRQTSVSKDGWVVMLPGQRGGEIQLPRFARVSGHIEMPAGLVGRPRVDFWSRRAWLESVLADADGRFVLPAVPVGTYRATVRVSPTSGLRSHSESVKVERDTEVRFKLVRGQTTTICVVGPDGAPVVGAIVATSQNTNTGQYLRTISESTDAEGRVTFRGMPAKAHSYAIECALGTKSLKLAPGDHRIAFPAPPQITLSLERVAMPEGTICTIEFSRPDEPGIKTAQGIVADGTIVAKLPKLDPGKTYEVGIKARGAGVKGDGFYSPWAPLSLSADGRVASATVRVFRWDEDEDDG